MKESLGVSTRPATLDLSVRIMNAYGYATACRLLRRRRAPELLPGRRTPRRDAAGCQSPDPLARAAARNAAPRPLRTARRAHRGRLETLRLGAADARARAAAAPRGHRRS